MKGSLRLLLIFLFAFTFSINGNAQVIITTIAGIDTGLIGGYSGDGGPATAARLYWPMGVAKDKEGNIYIADRFNNRIRKISTLGVISTIAGIGGAGGFSGDGGPATAAEIKDPWGIAIDSIGNIYFADAYNNRVRKIDTSGIITTIAGTGFNAHTGDGGAATAASICQIRGIKIDAAGNIYTASSEFVRIRKINTSGIITTIAGTGHGLYSGDGGPATNAEMTSAEDIVIDPAGNVYISDYGNHRIRKVNTAGIISTFAGTGIAAYGGDGGPASAAQLRNPTGLAIDAAGNIYVSDAGNNRIRKIDTTGTIVTIAGNGTAGFGGDGGPALAAMLAQPWSIYVDTGMNVYFADRTICRVRKLGGNNRRPIFTGGHSQSVTVCGNSIGDSINSLLPAFDTDTYQPEWWSLATPPLHGTAVAADTMTAMNDTLFPHGMYYTPTSGYYGLDSFRVRITDGYQSDTTTIHVTIIAPSSTISGTLIACSGSTTTLTDVPGGGSWSSDNIAVATVGSSTGVVSGLSAGTATISYNITGTCPATVIVTINPLPAGIAGVASVCTGSTTTLSTTTGGGAWSSGNPAIATIGSTGIVTGVTAGAVVITYTIPTGCKTTFPITVNAAPVAISGTLIVCTGLTTALSDGTGGGSWSSVSPAIATIGSTGIVTGISPGTDTIKYTLITGCATSKVVTVNLSPTPITGAPIVCVGTSTTLSVTTGGGTWSSGAPGVATIGSISGTVAGVSPGTATITYTLPTGCATTIVITVNPSPATITGSASVCAGFDITLADAVAGGTWSSGSPGIATVGSVSGVVTGLSTGTTIITYTLPAGCIATKSITVNPLPTAISGIADMCAGETTTLFDGTAGGTWTSLSPGIATVGSATGVITSVATGTAVISYVLPTGCGTSTTFTVDPSPATITGSPTLCVGMTTTLSDAVTGGYWVSDNPSIAGVDAISGVVTGVALGSATITYTLLGTGCYATLAMTVNPPPSPISGVAAVCVGLTTTLTDLVPGGVWSSGTPGVATVNPATGVVTGVSAGSTTITYSMGAGCTQSMVITVYAVPLPITGTTHVCLGGSTTLTTTTGGGTWSSSNTAVATVGSASGLVTGITAGVVTITYSAVSGISCYTTAGFTVNPLPVAIGGTLHVCPGGSTTLTETGGGTWASSNPAIATIGTATGIVTGVAPGTTIITYTLPTGCSTTAVMTVNTLPGTITGSSNVCIGTSTPLSATPAGGAWSSGNPAIATVGSSGIVTGISAGAATITYTLPTGCFVTKTVTSNSTPGAITGTLQICMGTTTTLSDPTPGGTWTSGNLAVATVVPTTGKVTAVSVGTAVITYTIGVGCVATAVVTVSPLPNLYTVTGGGSYCAGGTGLHIGLMGSTVGVSYQLYVGASAVGAPLAGTGAPLDFGLQSVAGIYTVVGTNAITGCSITMITSTTIGIYPLPAPITGPTAVCVGATITETDISTGGVWSAGSGIISIGSSSGVVTGIGLGATTVTYTLPTGCATTTTIIVSTTPPAITGAANVCVGATTMLSDGVGGGAWISSNPAVANIGSLSGVVTGMTMGAVTITYSLGTGCMVYKPMTVNAAPAAITGAASMCVGGSTTLTTTTGGGTWSSSNLAIATVGSTGVVSGISGGIATISYTIGTGCYATKDVTVNANPTAIGGPASVCMGAMITETDATPGGVWSSVSTTITIGSATGDVTGVSAGTASITYAIGTCITTRTIIVNTAPVITGAASVCVAGSTTLTAIPTGGVWSAGSGIVTIGSSSGIVTGVSAGTAMITYTPGTGCSSTRSITANTAPSAISGTTHVCVAGSTPLTVTTTGGIWSSGTPGVAAIGSGTGIVTGVLAGTSVITYSIGGCSTTITVTVNPLPAAISGTLHLCPGGTTTLTDGTTGGTWSSSDPAIATIGVGTGMVNAIVPGTTTISYALGTGCAATVTFTVTVPPGAITGSGTVCVASSTPLTVTPGGGVWSSSDPAVATVGVGTGIVSGVSAGSTIITYSLGVGCTATMGMSVNPLPMAITGTPNICIGATTTFGDATPGGVWSSTNTAIATIGSTGVINGVSGGTATISYTVSTGCAATYPINVIAVPPITGPDHACAWWDTIVVHNADTTGTFTSFSVTTFNLGHGAADVMAHAPGVAIVYYTIPLGCVVSKLITVNPLPAPIAGSYNICEGSTTLLSDISTGGAWSCGLPAIATVGSGTGVVSGVAGGTARVTYTLPTGCMTDTVITVSTFPLAGTITGAAAICVGGSATLTETITGGTWHSSNESATVTTGGVVTGVLSGLDTISYSITNVCGTAVATKELVVNAIPDAGTISGAGSVCVGADITLTSTVPGGTWDQTNGTASVSVSGVVTGLTAGTDTIIYTVTVAGCSSSSIYVVSVVPLSLCDPLVVRQQQSIREELRIWPDPNDGTFSVRLSSGKDEVVHVVITNMTGEKIKEYTGKTNETADIRMIVPAGVYFVSARTGSARYVGKVVVE